MCFIKYKKVMKNIEKEMTPVDVFNYLLRETKEEKVIEFEDIVNEKVFFEKNNLERILQFFDDIKSYTSESIIMTKAGRQILPFQFKMDETDDEFKTQIIFEFSDDRWRICDIELPYLSTKIKLTQTSLFDEIETPRDNLVDLFIRFRIDEDIDSDSYLSFETAEIPNAKEAVIKMLSGLKVLKILDSFDCD
jgi:hypothetical protein